MTKLKLFFKCRRKRAFRPANIWVIFAVFFVQDPPNTFFLENVLKIATEYFLKFLFFIWKYNPSD